MGVDLQQTLKSDLLQSFLALRDRVGYLQYRLGQGSAHGDCVGA